jgi:hypothetical protein
VRSMKHLRSAGTPLTLVLLCVLQGVGNAQNTARQSNPERHVLYLNGGSNGQQVTARVGQAMQITLQTIGPGQYGSPKISSTAIEFEGAAFAKEQIPGGPRQIYRFRARSEGEARVNIPHVVQLASGNANEIRDSNPAFALSIRVRQRQ